MHVPYANRVLQDEITGEKNENEEKIPEYREYKVIHLVGELAIFQPQRLDPSFGLIFV